MNPRRPTSRSRSRQRGAVLVVSLVMLVVLTLLGVSVMNITQLEERMAANTQEMVQSFQVAETGLSVGYDNDAAWNPTTSLTAQDVNVTNAFRTDQTTYIVEFLVSTNPPSGYDVAQFQRANFDFRSSGATQSGFTTELHGGGAQVFRKTGFLE